MNLHKSIGIRITKKKKRKLMNWKHDTEKLFDFQYRE